jgi:acyl-CoA synthetase (AMP-forming)/AMP-acid ligase II
MNIRELLEQQAENYSEKIFLYYKDEEITYLDFNFMVNRIANAFQKMGIRKGDMVAIMIPNSPAFLYSWLALNKIGAVEAPINIALKDNEMKYILQHSEATCLVIDHNCYEVFTQIKRDDVPNLKNVVYYGDEAPPRDTISFSSLLDEKTELESVGISEDDAAVCIYTSGTTDRPKAVLNSHKSWVLTGQAYAFTAGITRTDRVMTPNPLFHANAQVYSTMGSLAAGASLILLERFSASQILEQARLYGATKMVLVQAVTPWVWSRPEKQDDGENPVENMIAGGVPGEIYHDFERRFQLEIQTIYSLTESVFGIMGPRKGTQPRKPGGVGVPMEHPNPSVRNEVKIVDDKGAEVPKGKQGEIIIRNPATMMGYFKDPEKAAQTKRDGWIFTGDIGFQDGDGYFFFVGRKKDVIRRRGELISPLEIEGVIKTHPHIQEAVVIGVPSNLGIGEEEVKAYVRLKMGKKIEPQEIVSWCRERLSEFKIPRFVEFRDSFPTSAIGRVQRNLLKAEAKDLADGCYDRLREKRG